ncbi:unnamed protein product [Ectocarpus sp. 8 AP-2014]
MAGAGACSCCALILATGHACGSFFSNGFSRKVLVFTLITGGVDSRVAEKRGAVFLYIFVSACDFVCLFTCCLHSFGS